MKKNEIEKYFKARAKEVQRILKDGTPWGFLCAAAFLDCLSKLVEGKDSKRKGYKDFVRNYLKTINSEYASFRFNSGKTDLPEQLYHIFRCGIVHSFSLIPDKQSQDNGGRPHSIVLCHQKEAKAKNISHLSNYSMGIITDSCLFVAEDFGKDLTKVVKLIFSSQAKGIDADITKKMKQWIKQQPPISGGF
jgi:hypothetical protein